MYVLGGQDQVSGQPSTFYNDVWASRDGRSWTRLTEHAPWQARAGLSAVVKDGWIYVLGGSNGDDVAIGGSGRVLFDDVWRSRDGRSWQQVTADAPVDRLAPEARSSSRTAISTCSAAKTGSCARSGAGGLQCPYFNDVWRSRNGADWRQLTPSAAWTSEAGAAEPGPRRHDRRLRRIRMAGALRPDPAAWPRQSVPPRAPHRPVGEPRRSEAGPELAGSPWNAAGPADIKYDFDSLVVRSGLFGLRQSILTFGGDREISFVNPDPGAVDSDVWRATPRFWVW